MKLTDKITANNSDCMEVMAQYEDNHFDLAVVDPPYGIGEKLTKGGTWAAKYTDKDHQWDKCPSAEYFKELERVSKHGIIWGGNYYSHLIKPARCFIVWRKVQMLGMHTMADCELALTSFDANAKIFSSNNATNRIHPTQKPVKLYDWIFHHYAKPEFKILDTHGGSFSSAIAAHYYGCEMVICELDKEYFDSAVLRFKQQTRQLKLF